MSEGNPPALGELNTTAARRRSQIHQDQPPRLYLFINGILSKPSDVHAWTDRAEDWIGTHTNDRAKRYEYFSGALTRRLFQAKRAAEVAEIIQTYSHLVYSNLDIVLVGHSNGCDIICRVLRDYIWRVKAIHLFCGACDCNFEKNGLNRAVKLSRVEAINIYGSHSDKALKLAKRAGWLSYIGLGYGWLGLDGPQEMSNCAEALTSCVWREGYDHSTWFEPEHFEETMRLITQ